MKIRTTRKEVLQSFEKVYRISQELGNEISRYINPDYYTCGVYGWNSDIYKVNYSFALVYGYRPFGKEYPREKQQELLKKLDKLESRYNKGSIKFNTMMKKGREIINEFFLA